MEYRTNTHARGRSKKRNTAATAIVILISVILIAGIVVLSPLGDWLMEKVIEPASEALSPKEKKDNEIVSALKNQEAATPSPSILPSASPIQNSLNIVETPFYILQMGAFTDVTQTDTHAQKIRSMGAAGFVYQDGAIYRVFAAAYRDAESLEKVQGQVRTDGFEATPYITDQNSVHITLKGDENAVKALEEAIELMNKIPIELSSLSLAFDKEEIDETELESSLKSLQKDLEQAKAALQRINQDSIASITHVLENDEKHISTFLQEHDSISRTNAGELKLLQLRCIADYIQFFERK